MPITVTCSACGQSFSLREELAGRSVRCRCGRPLTVPVAGQGVLGTLLETELARPAERPPERKAPVYREEIRTSSAPAAPAHAALPGGLVLPTAKESTSRWGAGLWVALRSVVGTLGLCYGLLMLWFGAVVAWMFILGGIREGITGMPWFHIVFLGIALTGALMAVGSVGVLIGRKDAGPKLRFAAWTLVVLWIGWGALSVIVMVRTTFDRSLQEFTPEFWKAAAKIFFVQVTWAIAPLLIYLWCKLRAKRDLAA